MACHNVFVIAVCALLAVYYIAVRQTKSPSREISVVFAGLAIFALFAIENNLAYLIVLPQHEDFEPIGFFIFVCCLGYVTARRALAKEERLLAINKELQIANQIQSFILPREVRNSPAWNRRPVSAHERRRRRLLRFSGDRRKTYRHSGCRRHRTWRTCRANRLHAKVAFAGQTAHADDPVRVLTGLNRALCGKFEEHFVTAAYVFVDLDKFRCAMQPPGTLRC